MKINKSCAIYNKQKRKMPRQIIQSDGIFSAKNVKPFLKKSKKGSKMKKDTVWLEYFSKKLCYNKCTKKYILF